MSLSAHHFLTAFFLWDTGRAANVAAHVLILSGRNILRTRKLPELKLYSYLSTTTVFSSTYTQDFLPERTNFADRSPVICI